MRLRLGPLALVAAVLLSACDSDGRTSPASLGPLAVFDDPALDSVEQLGGRGRLTVGESCVTLDREEAGELLLAWRSAEVTFDEAADTIAFTQRSVPDGKTLTLSDGDIISVGGTEFTSDDGSEAKVKWIAEPDADCSGELFIVHNVVVDETAS